MFKKITTSIFLLNSVLLAHFFGGAPLRISNYFVFLAFLTFYLLPENLETGPNLAYLVLIFQGIGHLSLENSGSTNTHMGFFHVVAGIITYQFIVKFEQVIEILCEWFVPLILKRIYINILEFIRDFKHEGSKSLKEFNNYFLRGPPKYLAI